MVQSKMDVGGGMLVRAGVLGLLGSLLLSAGVEAACTNTDPSVTSQTGQSIAKTSLGGSSTITLNFQCSGGDCRCGTFAGEWDWWIAPPSPGGQITVTSISPAQTGSGSSTRHGASLDPSSTGCQGWDGRTAFCAEQNRTVPFTITPATVGRASVLVKARSQAEDNNCTVNTSNRMCTLHMEAFTFLNEPPSAVQFRPNYYGSTKLTVPLSDFSDAILPNFADAGSETTFASALRAVTSVHIDHFFSFTADQYFHAEYNYDSPRSGYDGYAQQKTLGAMVALLSNPSSSTGTSANKTLLAKRIAQLGIDYWGAFQNGVVWRGSGGFNLGMLPVILVTAALLDESSWTTQINTLAATDAGRHTFGETSYVQPANASGKNVPLFGETVGSGLGNFTTKTGSRTLADPNGRVDGGGNLNSKCISSYQICCTTSIIRTMAVIQLIPKVRDMYPANAEFILRWVERVTQPDRRDAAYCDANSFAFTYYTGGYKVPYVDDLYHAYYQECADDQDCAGQPDEQGAPTEPPTAPETVPAVSKLVLIDDDTDTAIHDPFDSGDTVDRSVYQNIHIRATLESGDTPMSVCFFIDGVRQNCETQSPYDSTPILETEGTFEFRATAFSGVNGTGEPGASAVTTSTFMWQDQEEEEPVIVDDDPPPPDLVEEPVPVTGNQKTRFIPGPQRCGQ